MREGALRFLFLFSIFIATASQHRVKQSNLNLLCTQNLMTSNYNVDQCLCKKYLHCSRFCKNISMYVHHQVSPWGILHDKTNMFL